MERFRYMSWAGLLVAMWGDLFFSVTLPSRYPGYSRMKDSISALGNPASPVRKIFNLWMFFEGVFFLIDLPVFHMYYHGISEGHTWTTIAFIIVFAVGACVFTCFFSVNESKSVITTASKIHAAGSVTGFMLFLFVPLLIALLSFKNSENTLGGFSIFCFVLSLITFVLFVISDKPFFKNTFFENAGLWQRLNLIFMYLPLTVVAIKRMGEVYT